MVKRWRSMGHCNSCFFSGLPERVSAFAFSWVHQMDLKLCGLKLNKKKSKLEPMRVGQWLSFIIDTIGMQFRVPPEKIAKLKSNLDFIISSRTVTFRDLARVTGLINSLFVAVGLIAGLLTRQIHSTIQARSV